MEGVWTEDPMDVKRAISDHFHKQFQKKSLGCVELPMDFANATLDEIDGEFLTKEFIE